MTVGQGGAGRKQATASRAMVEKPGVWHRDGSTLVTTLEQVWGYRVTARLRSPDVCGQSPTNHPTAPLVLPIRYDASEAGCRPAAKGPACPGIPSSSTRTSKTGCTPSRTCGDA